MRASVSVSQCFRHVGTCVQLLSPLIFCLVSVLSGISTWRNGTPIFEERTSNQTQTQVFFWMPRSVDCSDFEHNARNLTLKGILHEED